MTATFYEKIFYNRSTNSAAFCTIKWMSFNAFYANQIIIPCLNSKTTIEGRNLLLNVIQKTLTTHWKKLCFRTLTQKKIQNPGRKNINHLRSSHSRWTKHSRPFKSSIKLLSRNRWVRPLLCWSYFYQIIASIIYIL